MADFNEYSQKGSAMMQQALEKLAEGNIKDFEKYRKKANELFDLFYVSVNSEAGKMTQLYGESRNFGIIYNVIEQNINGDVCKDAKTRDLIKEMYNIIKTDKVLNEQFKIYDLFEKSAGVENVKEFVNESVSLLKKFDKEQVKKSNNKLIDFIKEKQLDEYVEIPQELENLYEAIEFVILNEKTLDNVNDFIKAQNVIAEHIEKTQKENLNEERLDNKTLFNNFKEKVQEAENKLEENITDDERKLLDFFTNKKINKKAFFEEQKRNTLKKLDEVISKSEEADKAGWKEIYEAVSKKEFSQKMSENIVSCAEMLEICSTIDE